MAPYSLLPTSFQKSYIDRDSYPRNLIQRTVGTYPSALAAYATRLDLVAQDLFERDISQLEVSFRDLKTDNGKGKGLVVFVPILTTYTSDKMPQIWISSTFTRLRALRIGLD